MKLFRIFYLSMMTNNNGSIDVYSDSMSDSICETLRKFPYLIIFSSDEL